MNLSLLITLFYLSVANATPQLEQLKEQFPKEFTIRMELTPRPTRAGHLRFVGSKLADPKWAPLYLSRYNNYEESEDVRRALLDLIHRSLGELPQVIFSGFEDEPELIRATILDLSAYGSVPPEVSAKDPSPLVRAAFIRQVAKSSRASNEYILTALNDLDEKVLADAARAAHQKGCTKAIPALSRLVLQYNNTVALRSLYALSKLDIQHARALVQKHQLSKSNNKNLAIFAEGL